MLALVNRLATLTLASSGLGFEAGVITTLLGSVLPVVIHEQSRLWVPVRGVLRGCYAIGVATGRNTMVTQKFLSPKR